MDPQVLAAIIGGVAAIVAAVIGAMLAHRRADSGRQTPESTAGSHDRASALRPPTSAYAEIGPLTLGAELKTPADVERYAYPPAYPTGAAGAHFVFPLHNPNRVDFIVVALEVEVLSYQQIEIERLIHGVGATDTMRRFKVEIQPHIGRYRATYGTEELFSDYVRVLAANDDVFDLEITTGAEGLFDLCVHVKGTLDGEAFDVPVRSHSVVFFDRHSHYMVERSDTSVQRFEEYIGEISQRNSQLGVYLSVD
jgi:hypothetical protein